MTTILLSLIDQLKYFGIFAGAFIEGPTVGLIAGFFSRLHYLNFFTAYLVHVSGDFLADSIYYAIGYSGSKKILSYFTRWFNIPMDKAEKTKKIFYEHPCKIIIIGKLTHILGLPILVGAGLARYSWPKFLFFNFLATIIKSAALLSIGYYLADRWQKAESIFSYISLAGIALLVLLFFYFWGRYFFKNKGGFEKS